MVAPPVRVGCADGTVEVEFNANIVGCDGEWGQPGIANGAALCGAGWSVCGTDNTVSGLGLLNCNIGDPLPNGNFYATAESSSGWWRCHQDEPNNYGTNDVWGCGASGVGSGQTCGPLNTAIATFIKPPAWIMSGSNGHDEATRVYKTAGNGGVMCCRDEISPVTCIPSAIERCYTMCDGCQCVDLRQDATHHHVMYLTAPNQATVDYANGDTYDTGHGPWSCTCAGTCDGIVGTWSCPGFYQGQSSCRRANLEPSFRQVKALTRIYIGRATAVRLQRRLLRRLR